MGYFLRQIDPGNQTPLHIILKSDETVLGRSTFDELTKYKEVSRRHALVFKNIINGEDHWFVRDLKSLNGVFVNGVLIEHEQEIKIGDHIGLGVQGPSGFRCTLSLPPANQKKVLFIDITEDDPIFIKCEPIEDACVCGAQSDHPSTSSARQCTCISNCDSQNIKSCTGNDVSSGSKGNESSSINSTFQKCSDKNYADSFNNGRASVEKHCTSDSIWFSKDRFANKNTVLANSSSKIDNVEILPDSHSLKPPHIEVETDSNVEEKHSSFMKKNDPLTKDSSLSPFHGTKGGNFKARIEKNISSIHPANEPLVKPSEQIPTISKRSEHVSTESDSVNNLERTRTETVPKLSKRGHYNMIVKNENQYESGSSNKQLQEEKNKMLANVKYAIGQETISAKNSVRKCHVPLVRCDSKHFKWPPGNIVKKIVIPQPVEENVSFKHLFSSCRSLSTETVLLEYNPKKSVPESTNVIFQHRLFINANTNNNIVNASVKHQAQDKDLSNNALTAGDGPSNLISSSISKSLSNLIINNQAPKPTSEIKSKPALVNVVSPYFITSSRSETVAANLTDSQELSNSNYGYSQVEDVIVISDDESYMDFNCSQLVIKEEPMEIESDIDSEEEIFGDLNKYEGSGDELALDDCDSFRKSQENIENIRKFIDSTSDTSIQVKQMAPSVDDTTEQNMDVFDYFPASQLNMYEDSESTSNTNEHINNNDDSDSDCDGNCLNIVKVPSIVFNTKDRIEDCDSSNGRLNQLSNTTNSKKRVSQIKSVGRTLLTLPKNMDRRPKYKRGREEWFEEKQLEDQAAIENRSMINPKTKKVNNKKPLKPRTPKKKSEKTPLERLYKKSNLDAYKIPKKPKTDASPKKDKRLPSTSSTLRKAEEAQSKISSFNRGDEHQRIQAAQKRKAPAIARTHGKVSRSESFLSDLQTNNARTAVPREKKTARKEVFKSSSTEKSNVNKQPLTSVNLMPPNRPLMHNQHLVPNKQGYRPPSFTHFSSNPPLSSKIVQAVNEPPQVQELTDNRNSTTAFDQPFHSEHLKNTLNLMQAAKFPKQVCPVPPSRVSSRDPRLARSMSSNSAPNTIVNPMLKYNNATFTSVAPSQPVVPNYCTGNQHPFVSKNNIQSQSFVNSAITTYNKPLPSMFHPPPETSVRDSLAKQAHLWGMIKRIVELNVKWIEEQKNESEPPPDVRSGAANLPVCFSSPEEYITLFYSMLMLEVWDIICQESKLVFENERRHVNKFYFVVKSIKTCHNMVEYTCEAAINHLSFPPWEGNLVILDIVDERDKRANPSFGYINRSNCDKEKALPFEFSKLSSSWLENAKVWEFHVFVKNRGDKLRPMFGKVMKGNGICSIKNKVRLVDNLRLLNDSPLGKSILRPENKTFAVNYPNVSPGTEFNNGQKKVIEGITRELKYHGPKIMLLQGPPGTGKTHTIIGLLEKLLFDTSNRQKILITAPSNAAVDEIGKRLIDLNSRLKQPVKFVRVGMPSQINKNMMKHTLDEKAIQMFKDDETKYKSREIKTLKIELDRIKYKEDHKTDGRIKFLEEQIKKMDQQLSDLKSDYRSRKKYKLIVLQNSDIVLSTLGSCCQNDVISVFQPNSRNSFTCCILDEASQCTEIEVLQVLNFGISKLVLIGDHQQLPATVSSKFATKYGYERSMFERFHIYFSEHARYNPTFMLTEQFRMHSEICRFPSKQFYRNLLVTSPKTDIQYQAFPIEPYMVYNIIDSQESNSDSSKTNQKEALAIAHICDEVLRLNFKSKPSIGIITPYAAQRSLYENAFKSNPNYRQIEVNTVDGFQGREKDVIIVSCVRANSSNGRIGFLSCKKRLNVAITRAKYCLIICGHSNTLSRDPNWRALIEDAVQRNLCQTVVSANDIRLVHKNSYTKRR